MKGIFIALLLGSACQALPNYGRLFSTINGGKSAADAIVLPNGASLPENTLFLSQQQSQEGNTIHGEYSYKYPQGSLVTVKYTMDANGENYSEDSKIEQSNGLDNIPQLSPNFGQGIGEHITLVSSSASASVGNNFKDDQVVSNVIANLKPQIIKIVGQIVTSGPVDNEGQSSVVEKTITHLRPIVQSSVIQAASASGFKGHIDIEYLIHRILSQLKNDIESSVHATITQHKPQVQQEAEAVRETQPGDSILQSEDTIVQKVNQELRPTVIQVVKDIVEDQSEDLSDEGSMVNQITVKLRPIVQQNVVSSLGEKSQGNLNSERITDRIINELTSFIQDAVQQEVKQHQTAVPEQSSVQTEDIIVQKVHEELKPTVIQVVKDTVLEQGDDLSDQASMVDQIAVKVRPIVQQNVISSLGGTSKGSLNSDKITDRIINELTSFIREAVQNEVEQLLQLQPSQQTKPEITENEIVLKVTTELRPTIIKVVKETVQQNGIDLSNQENLIIQITIKLRPIVYQIVVSSLGGTSKGNLNADSITDRILSELTSFIREAVQQEVQLYQLTQQPASTGLTESAIVEKVIVELRPTVIRVVKETVQQNGVDLSNQEDLIIQITIKLRPIVYQIVVSSLGGTSKGDLNADSITDRILTELTVFIREAVQQEVKLYQQTQQPASTGLTESAIVEKVIAELRPTVIKVVKETVQQKGIDLSNQENLVIQITIKLRPIVYQIVVSSLGGTSKGNLNADSITDRIISELTVFIREAVRQEVDLHLTNRPSDVQLTADQEEQIIVNVVLNLDSTIKSLVGKSLESSKPLTESQVESFVTGIMNQLKTQIINLFQIQLNGYLSGSAQAFFTSNSYEILLQKIFLEIRKLIIAEIQVITENSSAPTKTPGYSGSLSLPSGPASRPTGPISHPYGPVSGTYGPPTQPSVPIQSESDSKSQPTGPISQATGTKPQPAGSLNQPLGPTATPSGPMSSKSMAPMAPMAQSIFGNSATNFVKFQSPSYNYEFTVD